MKTRNVSTWEEFEKGLEDVRLEYQQTGEASRLPLLFRGQENACWPLSTTLDRKRERMLFAEYYGVISKIRLQIETLTGSEWPIPNIQKCLRKRETMTRLVSSFGAVNARRTLTWHI